MSCALDVIDCFGRMVVLDHSNWVKHINTGRHLEVVQYLEHFPSVLSQPDRVIDDRRRSQRHYYKRGIAGGRYTGFYLQLVVGEFNGIYKITTWRLVPRIDPLGSVLV